MHDPVQPTTRISGLPQLTDLERRQMLVDWNTPAVPCLAAATIHALFTRQARRAPDAIALQYEDSRLSCGDPDQRSDQLAWTLIRRGIRAGSRIGLLMDRGFELVLDMLGVLKAGCAYVPLEPVHPLYRLPFMIPYRPSAR